MNKQFLITLAVIVAALGGLFWFTRDEVNNSNGGNNSGNQVSNHTQGAGNKGVTLVEYGDFQCPGCYRYYPVVKEVKARYGDDITFQFRNFPLIQIHPNAMAAHRAAEASSLQGKFFEMHDLLYEGQPSWTEATTVVPIFESYAQELGLDMVKFKQDFASAEVNNVINADVKAGQDLDVGGTPTFFINGKKYEVEDVRSVDDFYKAIDEAIAAKQAPQ